MSDRPAPDLKVVTLDCGDIGDIPALMERCAAAIRDGERGDVVMAACVLLQRDGTPILFSWGRDADELRTIGMLQVGANWLAARNSVRG